jgi:hypothetical protein
LNAIQVRIDENVWMLAELHASWEREDEMGRKIKVCTITTSNDVVPKWAMVRASLGDGEDISWKGNHHRRSSSSPCLPPER